jgi:hypothetical protein
MTSHTKYLHTVLSSAASFVQIGARKCRAHFVGVTEPTAASTVKQRDVSEVRNASLKSVHYTI